MTLSSFAQEFTLSFMSIFVAMDIIGVLPLYIAFTRSLQVPARRPELVQLVNQSILVAFLVALVFAFIGHQIFHVLGVQLYDFKVAGGIVLLLIGIADLHSGPDAAKNLSGSTGVVPLAVPLITGPGVLTALALQIPTFGYFITILSLLANYLLAWVILRKSDRITRVIGHDGTVVISKLAALLLVAIAIAMIRSGLFEAIDGFRLSHK